MGDEMTEFVLDKKLCIEAEYGQVLMDLVEKSFPAVVVEVGTGQGYSTAWLLKGLLTNKHGQLMTFDSVDRSPYAWDAEGLPTHRLRKFNCEFKDADKLLPSEIDFVFHDAGHWIEHLKEDLALVLPRMDRGGIIAVHDIVYSNDMGEKLKIWFESMPEWSYREMRDGCGLGIAERVK